MNEGDRRRSVRVDLGRHRPATLADLRRALDVPVGIDAESPPLHQTELHRAMEFGDDPAEPNGVSRHLAAGWRPDERGRFTVSRSPDQGPGDRPNAPRRPEPPGGPEPLPPIPWSLTVPGLVVAAVVGLRWSPLFAVIGAVSSLTPLLHSLGPRVLQKRTNRRHDRALAEHAAAISVAEDQWAEALAAWLEDRTSSPGRLDEGVVSGTIRPWNRRLANAEALAVAIGRGRSRYRLDVDRSDSTSSDADRELEDVPLILDLDRGLAIDGDRADALDLARWILIETAFRHGPADLLVTLVTTDDRVVDWEWMRWLPSLRGVAVEPDELIGLLDFCGSPSAAVTQLVVVDGAVPSGPGPLARLLAGQVRNGRVLWLGEPGERPAVCDHEVRVTADGRVRLVAGPRTAGAVDGPLQAGWAWRLGADEAEEFASFLAPFDDPEIDVGAVELPAVVPLDGLCTPVERDRPGTALEGARSLDPGCDAIEQRWARATSARLRMPLGVGVDGPIGIDLVADGPHGLVAGTTGAGKSELLRTLVLGAAIEQPPEMVSFVLIDFKGGGAFDAVAGLPHVAAVVTDLDPAEAGRALRSLRAELRHRELVLRDAGVSDVAELRSDRAPGPAGTSRPRSLSRLVIVIDEFAALAEELPEFLTGLVDVARRGRSLGVHLILATQRPSGVVTPEIRSNTNLRVCLRVRDVADSVDVLGTADAATLPAVPGRAVVSTGGGMPRRVQVAYPAGTRHLAVQPFVLRPRQTTAPCDEAWPTTMISSMWSSRPTRAQAPWLPPLPARLPAGRLWSSGVGGAERTGSAAPGPSPLGALDDPDGRRRIPLEWDPSSGGLLVAGADHESVASTVRTAITALAIDQPDRHVLVLDGGRSAALERLGLLASVVDVVTTRDRDRLAGAFRFVQRRRRSAGLPLVLVIHGWGAVTDALVESSGPESADDLARSLVGGSVVPLISVSSDRELPGRVLAPIRRRLVHRLADPAGSVAFGLPPRIGATTGAHGVVEVESGLHGVVAIVDDDLLARVAADSSSTSAPPPIRVVGDRVDRRELDDPVRTPGGWSVPIGLDEDGASVAVEVSGRRPVVILGHPGSGRSTALATVAAGLDRLGIGADASVLIDDAERLDDAEARERLDRARCRDLPLVVAVTIGDARRFGGWLAPLLSDATVILLNPGRSDGELVRARVPDLSRRGPGRAVVVDRGGTIVVQVAH